MTGLGWAGVIVAVVAALRGTWSPCGLSMISAINPFSERSRGHRYWLTALWFVAGSAAAGALLGGVIAGLAWCLRPVVTLAPTSLVLIIASVVGLIALASDLRLGGFHLPNHPRQVNERWLGGYRRWVYAAGFGVQIGAGFATYIMTATTYLMVAFGALSGSPATAWVAGMTFGTLRGLAVLLSARARSPAALRRLHTRLDRVEPWSRRGALSAEAASAMVLTGAAVGLVGAAAVGVVAVTMVLARAPHRGRRTVMSAAVEQ